MVDINLLKFRVWEIGNNKYSYFNIKQGLSSTIDEITNYMGIGTVEQYTTYKDKDLKSIYENDILKVELFNLQNQSFEIKFNYYIDERIKLFIKNNLYLKEDNDGDYKNISLCLDNCDTNLGDFTLEK